MTEIVEKTGVVGVSFNYRLGPLVFFSHPDEPSARRSESFVIAFALRAWSQCSWG